MVENNNWLNRTEILIGKENIEKLRKANIVVFGLGGVGSYVVEGLVRAGIGNITIVDKDIVDTTNINRQLIATTDTIGKAKTEVETERILKINPNINITSIQEFVDSNNIDKIMQKAQHYPCSQNAQKGDKVHVSNIDYVVDAIDTVSSKLEIIRYCWNNNIKLISCMGTGNKLDPSQFEITDINKTSVCPLAKVIRKELKKLNINKLKVIYSKETPIKTNISSPASISFVPSVAGLLIAGEVIRGFF